MISIQIIIYWRSVHKLRAYPALPVYPTRFALDITPVIGYAEHMTILFVQTGGTIDKDYPENDDNHGYYFDIGEPAFFRTLERANPDFSYKTLLVTRKDSLDLTDEDRALIKEAIVSATEERIVITHGTDTIHKTAKELRNVKGKTVVLTGSRLPEKFYESEADFNLGMAIAGAQVLPHGIYIALYGLIIPWDKFSNK